MTIAQAYNTPTMEQPNKRRNLTRWQQARLRRLSYSVNRGWASALQAARAHQLAETLFKKGELP